mmetsp:Transcript_11623/g.43664  ORF Transcript_11623/g.43664 Transcript_11623/m.43664 type:complete len:86 (-) Transcript_11623:14-271(-)
MNVLSTKGAVSVDFQCFLRDMCHWQVKIGELQLRFVCGEQPLVLTSFHLIRLNSMFCNRFALCEQPNLVASNLPILFSHAHNRTP